MISPEEALKRLEEGNRRFTAHLRSLANLCPDRRAELVAGQAPFAIILGCSDSRVPAELIFDQGFGDLFVIRVAGNIAAPSQVESIAFAASTFGTRLVVVLGHTRCGAVSATLQAIGGQPHPLRAITERIRPAVEGLLDQHLPPEDLLREAVRANVRATVAKLRRDLPQEGLQVVGAEYALETGKVEFFITGHAWL